MIKSFMKCFDVLFPINLGPLTYICPEALAEVIQPGLVIQAQLKNKLTRGIVLGKNISPPDGPLKELQIIPGQTAVLSKAMLKLIRWISDYYIAPEGLVLKQTLPAELFTKTKFRKTNKEIFSRDTIDFMDIAPKDLSDITAAINSNKYTGFLLHAPSLLYEYSMVSSLLKTTGNIIVLLPDIAQANLLHDAFKDLYAERLCLLHGEISKGKRSENIEGILSGRYDIVIGTRAALFAPLKKVSLIIVLNEHSHLYKIEEGSRYNIRDVAVMRGFIEKTTVLLSSISPSIDSYFNAITHKYRLLDPPSDIKRPNIRIADMRYEKKIRPDLSQTVYDAARKHIMRNNKVIFIVNRRGYSTLLLCHDCSNIEKCGACDIPMVLYKDDNSMKCHYCGKIEKIPERCGRCKSHNLELLGSGTQRVQEYIEELFGMATLRFDSDNVKKRSEKEELARLISGNFSRVLIGTKMLTGHIMVTDKYSMAAVLNVDQSLNLPDFRATEKAYQELSAIIDMVGPGGEVLIQTRFSEAPVFKHLRNNNYVSFAKEELSMRKSLTYPPYAKLLKMSFNGSPEVPEKIIKIIHEADPEIEILGPTINKKGPQEFSIILKSVDRKALNTAARRVLKTFDRSKKIQIRTDVDPA
jgi:primosomal protein N' (replication factor Y)